jgi:RNA polymerase sigma factor (sigma-70 family)
MVLACLKGDRDAWESLIRRYRRLIYSIPSAYGLRASQADDVFQTVALKLVQHLPTVRKSQNLAGWISVTTRRECLAVRRGSSRLRELDESQAENIPDDPPDVAEKLHAVECEHTVALALERLGEPCRTLLRMLYVEEPTPDYKEISERLGRPVGSLGPTRSRCLRKLQEGYARLGGAEP